MLPILSTPLLKSKSSVYFITERQFPRSLSDFSILIQINAKFEKVLLDYIEPT